VVVLLGIVVVVDGADVPEPRTSIPVFGNVDAGEFDVTRNVTEPRMTATEPRTAHDHHNR
jgi:hypothetical protein